MPFVPLMTHPRLFLQRICEWMSNSHIEPPSLSPPRHLCQRRSSLRQQIAFLRIDPDFGGACGSVHPSSEPVRLPREKQFRSSFVGVGPILQRAAGTAGSPRAPRLARRLVEQRDSLMKPGFDPPNTILHAVANPARELVAKMAS